MINESKCDLTHVTLRIVVVCFVVADFLGACFRYVRAQIRLVALRRKGAPC